MSRPPLGKKAEKIKTYEKNFFSEGATEAPQTVRIVQNDQPLQIIKEKIKTLANITEIYLREIDDNVVDLLVKNAPNLKVFSVAGRFIESNAARNFTKTGMESICKFKSLDKLTINLWWTYDLMEEDFVPIVKNKQFQDTLKSLYLAYTIFGSDGNGNIVIEPIPSFKKLTYLNLAAAGLRGFTSKGLAAIFSSPSIANSLTTFKLYQFNCPIDDDAFGQLAACTALEKLSLVGPSSVTTPQLEKTLPNLVALKHLVLDKQFAPASSAGLTKLQSLKLENWSKMTPAGVTEILSNGNLRSLFISWRDALINNTDQLSKLPLKTLQLVNVYAIHGLKALFNPSSPLLTSLKKFTFVTNAQMDKESLASIGSLSSVTFLRIFNGWQFGDEELNTLATGPIKDSIEYLQLNGSTITNEGVSYFGEFSKLKGLMLFAPPVDEIGWHILLTLPNIQKAQDFYFQEIPWDESTKQQLQTLKRVHSLIIIRNWSSWPPPGWARFVEKMDEAQSDPHRKPYMIFHATPIPWHPHTLNMYKYM